MKVVVAGAGITGLSAAHALLRAGACVTVLESSDRLGGKIATERVDGFTLEDGPDSFLTLRPAGMALLHELGLCDEVVAPSPADAVFVWHKDHLAEMPAGLGMGVPTRFTPFLRSRLFSPREKARAAMEMVVRPAERSGDVSIGTFLRRRFGDAVVDRVAGPLIAGIYGASIDELSLDALMPQLRDAERRHGSLVRAGIAARRARRTAGGPVPTVTLREGMGSLVDALAARLDRADVRLGTGLVGVSRSASGYTAHTTRGTPIDADAIVVATPAPAAAIALGIIAPAAARALAEIPYRGTAAVSLGYEARQLRRPLRGHGSLVPDGALPVAAITWTSAMWPGRAPEGKVLVRATVRRENLLACAKDDLADVAHRAVARAMGMDGEPILRHVAMHRGSMPRYTVGHLERLERIRIALQPFPGIALAGAAYRGSGVPDCIAQGQAAAERALAVEAVAA